MQPIFRFICAVLFFSAVGQANAGERDIHYLLDNFRVGSSLEDLEKKFSPMELEASGEHFEARLSFSGKEKFQKTSILIAGPKNTHPLTAQYVFIETTLPSEMTADQISSTLKRFFGETFQYQYNNAGIAAAPKFHSYFWGDGCLLPTTTFSISGVTSHAVFAKSRHIGDNYLFKIRIQDAAFWNPIYQGKPPIEPLEKAHQTLRALCVQFKS